VKRVKLLGFLICAVLIVSGVSYCVLILKESKPPPVQPSPSPKEEGKGPEPIPTRPEANISETWKITLEQARTNRHYKYGIYASRILAVCHPEIYLKADALFLSYLGDLKFSLETLNLESVKTIESKQVYPDGYDYLPFLDRRLLSITSTLMSTKHEVTQIERSVWYYFERKKTNGLSDLFLIYCNNENTYLYCKDKLVWMRNLQNVDKMDGNPVLIFNEETVWYPLMNRDDTNTDLGLKTAVGRYSTNITTPNLADIEAELVDTLRVVTRLPHPEERQVALALSLKVGARLDFIDRFPYLTPNDLDQKFIRSLWRGFLELNSWGTILKALAVANYLSPITIHLVSISSQYQGEARIGVICAEYRKHLMLIGNKWDAARQYVMYTIDESYISQLGDCGVYTSHATSVLNLLHISHYMIHGSGMSRHEDLSHMWIYVPTYDLIISNMGVTRHHTVIEKIKEQQEAIPFNMIDFVMFEDNWAEFRFWTDPSLFEFKGNISPNRTIPILDDLREIHDEAIAGRACGWRQGRFVNQEVSILDLVQYLQREQDHWKPVELP